MPQVDVSLLVARQYVGSLGSQYYEERQSASSTDYSSSKFIEESPMPISSVGDLTTSGRKSTNARQYLPKSIFRSIFSCFATLSLTDIINIPRELNSRTPAPALNKMIILILIYD